MMRLTKFAAVLCLLVSGAAAQNGITFDSAAANQMIARLGAGACLRGPLTIYHPDGTIAFDLAAGVYYPSGCAQ